MPQDSTTPGYLLPTLEPVADGALDQVFHTLIVGISGLPGNLVRPRWQPEPPSQPGHAVNWCAMGVTMSNKDAYAYQGSSDTEFVTEKDETLELLLSFYGPLSNAYASRCISGIQLGQNRETLYSQGVAYSEVGTATTVPVLLQQKWAKRVDVRMTFRRREVNKYAVATLVAAQGTLTADATPVITRPIISTP